MVELERLKDKGRSRRGSGLTNLLNVNFEKAEIIVDNRKIPLKSSEIFLIKSIGK
jgi:hypothetical protein